MTANIIKVKTEVDVINKLALDVENLALNAIQKKGVFRVGLSGGSLVKYLSSGLSNIKSDRSKWQFYFCDERYVPESDPESTFGLYKDQLIPKTNLNESQFIKINLSLSLDECAQDYEQRIFKEFNITTGEIPKFDLLLLGMGPDGHTCSLFPGHKLLKEKKKLIAEIDDSPKPPPQRVTMTYPLINNADVCIFAMAGAGKAEMVKKVFIDKEALPARLVNPSNGKLFVILDETAGAFVKN